MNGKATGVAAIAALACAGSLQAHHSGSMYAPTPVWVKGTVVRFEGINPHTIMAVEERGADGQVRRWGVEGPGQSQLDRAGLGTDVPAVGDVIEFCAFPYKSPDELARLFPGADFSARRASPDADGSSMQFVSGHVMVMPNGEKRLLSPHGMMSECIRSSDDPRQSWLDFVNSSRNAREAWCDQRKYAHVQSSASLTELVEETNGLLDRPCE